VLSRQLRNGYAGVELPEDRDDLRLGESSLLQASLLGGLTPGNSQSPSVRNHALRSTLPCKREKGGCDKNDLPYKGNKWSEVSPAAK
jgi:hypothetical protein